MPSKVDGRLRRFVMIQLGKVYKIYQPGTLLLLVLTNSLLFTEYLERREVHPYVAIVLVFNIFIIVLWVAAHIYTRWLNMNEFQHRADTEFNPYAVNHLTPLDEMRWRTYYIPSMTAYYKILEKLSPSDPYLLVLKTELDKIKNWVELGFIPDSDAPPHLKDLFKSKMEVRL